MDSSSMFNSFIPKDKKENDSNWPFDKDFWAILIIMLAFWGSDFDSKDNHSFDKDYITYQSGMIDAYRDILKGDK